MLNHVDIMLAVDMDLTMKFGYNDNGRCALPFEKFYEIRKLYYEGVGKGCCAIKHDERTHQQSCFHDTVFRQEMCVAYITHVKFSDLSPFNMYFMVGDAKIRCHNDLMSDGFTWMDVMEVTNWNTSYEHWSKEQALVTIEVKVDDGVSWELSVSCVVIRRDLISCRALMKDEMCLSLPDVGQKIMWMLDKRSMSSIMCVSKAHLSYSCRILQKRKVERKIDNEATYASQVVLGYYERLLLQRVSCTGKNCDKMQYRCSLCHPLKVKDGTALLEEAQNTMLLWLQASWLKNSEDMEEFTSAEIMQYMEMVSQTQSYEEELHFAIGIIRNAEDNETYSRLWKKILRLWVTCLGNYDESLFKQHTPRSLLARRWVKMIGLKKKYGEST